MSEYQRYEFMTADRPLSQSQLLEVRKLSSHIEASSSHALIEYDWGDFKHDPVDVLHTYFDGFLYWANWGSRQLAFRFPHGVLPANLLDGYDLDEYVTFTRFTDFDILNILYGEMEPDELWVDYELGPLMPLRDELMAGDLRWLYIVWLATLQMFGGYDEEENYDIEAPPVPPGLGEVTSAQQSLADLLRLPEELLAAAAQHSASARSSASDDVAALIELLPAERRMDYLTRLANDEPGLSRLLVSELRAPRPDREGAQRAGECVTFATLLAESRAAKERLEQERRERERQKRLRHLHYIHDHQDEYWQRATEAVERGSGPGYDEATRLLVEMREVAGHFDASQQFQKRFVGWVQPHLKRPSFVKRLLAQRFQLPAA